MNKAELVEALAQHYDGSKTEAAKALEAVVQTITRSTVAGERVAITGFGVFERVERPARIVRNPRTGERKEAPATAVPRFRAGTELKAYVAGQRELPELAVATAEPAASRTSSRSRRPAAAPRSTVAQEALVDPEPAGEVPTKTVASKKVDGKKVDAKKVDGKKATSTKVTAPKVGSKKAASGKSAGKKADAARAESKKSTKKSKKKSAKK